MFQVTQKRRTPLEHRRRVPAPGARAGTNLQVVTGAHALGLESRRRPRDRRALRAPRRGAPRTARAEREVILAAGSIGSPQLLLLSGIGPADHLREVGVEVRHDLPGVGRAPPGPSRS